MNPRQSRKDVSKIFKKVEPNGLTPLGGLLADMTRGQIGEGMMKKKMLNYLFITDGVPSKLSQPMPREAH
jgi:hypothetical protein